MLDTRSDRPPRPAWPKVAVGVMLLLDVPHAATVSYLLLPFGIVFWIGFALPLGAPLGIARTILLLLA